MTKNIMIVGVGGQGSLLASKLLGHLLLTEGYDVKVSEVHGMSQRGGSVVTYVRFGEKVYSPNNYYLVVNARVKHSIFQDTFPTLVLIKKDRRLYL